MASAPRSSALLRRVVTGSAVLAIVLVLLAGPGLRFGFSAFIALLAAIGFFELCKMAEGPGFRTEMAGGIVACTLLTLSGHWGMSYTTNLALLSALLLIAVIEIVRGFTFAGLAVSMFGVVYIGWFGAHIVLLRAVPDLGIGLVLLLLVAISVSDTMAYVIGSLIGRHKLAPRVSPGKTWEGSIAGLVFALFGVWALYAAAEATGWQGLPDWSPARYLTVAGVLAVVGQIGDLTESCLKRDAGVKDSGALFPGHGGVLDRCDGFLFAAPVLYYTLPL